MNTLNLISDIYFSLIMIDLKFLLLSFCKILYFSFQHQNSLGVIFRVIFLILQTLIKKDRNGFSEGSYCFLAFPMLRL